MCTTKSISNSVRNCTDTMKLNKCTSSITRMKVTVYPCEKSTFKAVAWYAKHLSPTGMDAYVETIGDSFSLSLNKQVFLLKNISVTPIVKGEPLANRDGHVEIYAELVIEGPLEDDIVTFIETAKQ